MVRIKYPLNVYYPIYPKEIAMEATDYSVAVLSDSEVKGLGCEYSEVRQNLPSSTIRKIYNNSLKKYIAYDFLKNIPKDIIRDIVNHYRVFGLVYSEKFDLLIRNPFFMSKYIKYFTEEELNHIFGDVDIRNLLKSKQNPKFDITKVVRFDKKNSLIIYEDEFFLDYNFSIHIDKKFVENAEFDNKDVYEKLKELAR